MPVMDTHDTHSLFDPPLMLLGWLADAMLLMVPVAVLMAACWGAKGALKALFGIREPFSFYTAAAMLAGALLAFLSLFVLPKFEALFASFGADLPLPALLMMKYRYLLLVPAAMPPLLFWKLRKHARRESLFAAVLAAEFLVLVICWAGMALPVFKESVAA